MVISRTFIGGICSDTKVFFAAILFYMVSNPFVKSLGLKILSIHSFSVAFESLISSFVNPCLNYTGKWIGDPSVAWI